MKKILGICDEDSCYGRLLGENLSRREFFPFEISAFSDSSNLIKAINKEKLSIVLISEKIYAKIKDEGIEEKTKIIILNEGLSLAKEFPSIWKYQSAEEIRKEIMKIVSNSKELQEISNAEGKINAKIIGIYSPVKKEAETAFTLTLSHYLAKKGRSILISLREYSALNSYIKLKEDKDIADLIYFLRSGRDKFVCTFESMVNQFDGFDYIMPAYSFLDLKAIKRQDWLDFIQEIEKLGNYKYIVLELSEIDDGLLDILRKCHVILELTNGTERELNIIKEYEKVLEIQEYEDLLNKIYMVKIDDNNSVGESIDEIYKSQLADIVRQEIEKIVNEV